MKHSPIRRLALIREMAYAQQYGEHHYRSKDNAIEFCLEMADARNYGTQAGREDLARQAMALGDRMYREEVTNRWPLSLEVPE